MYKYFYEYISVFEFFKVVSIILRFWRRHFWHWPACNQNALKILFIQCSFTFCNTEYCPNYQEEKDLEDTKLMELPQASPNQKLFLFKIHGRNRNCYVNVKTEQKLRKSMIDWWRLYNVKKPTKTCKIKYIYFGFFCLR